MVLPALRDELPKHNRSALPCVVIRERLRIATWSAAFDFLLSRGTTFLHSLPPLFSIKPSSLNYYWTVNFYASSCFGYNEGKEESRGRFVTPSKYYNLLYTSCSFSHTYLIFLFLRNFSNSIKLNYLNFSILHTNPQSNYHRVSGTSFRNKSLHIESFLLE